MNWVMLCDFEHFWDFQEKFVHSVIYLYLLLKCVHSDNIIFYANSKTLFEDNAKLWQYGLWSLTIFSIFRGTEFTKKIERISKFDLMASTKDSYKMYGNGLSFNVQFPIVTQLCKYFKMEKWYFVSKIVLTICEKKNQVIKNNFLEQFILKMKGQNIFF